MRIERLLMQRVEGEAELQLLWKDGIVEDARISIPTSRGIEKVLIGRPYMDALVIVPRVCGICGHAHLMACVQALEDILGVVPTKKARLVRTITQSLEVLQNHIKWFYLFLMPEVAQADIYRPYRGKRWIDAIEVSSRITRAIALLSGQWPHASYAVPGGITSSPKPSDIVDLGLTLDLVKGFFQESVIEDIRKFLEFCQSEGLMHKGKAYNRLLSGGNLFNGPGYYMDRVIHGRLKTYMVEEAEPPSYSLAYPVRYKGLPFETGPLSRLLLLPDPEVRHMHRKYGDSFGVRVFARVKEIGHLVGFLEGVIKELKDRLSEPSNSLKRPPKEVKGYGLGVVEAARGTLIHSITVEKGLIREYRIITPSQWNLGPRCEKHLGVAEKAMIGLDRSEHAKLVLRSFDLCSVCTTH